MGGLDDIRKILDEYSGEVRIAVDMATKETATEAVKKLRKPPTPIRTGQYAKHWTQQAQVKRNYTTRIIYGKKPTYRLAHLLENGHAKRGGGRVAGIPHIKPVEEWAYSDVIERVVRKIGGVS